MAAKDVQNAVNSFLEKLKKKIHVSDVLLFGSRQVEMSKKDSDIDLLVVSKDFRDMSEDKRLDMLYKASQFIEPEIHPWAVTPEELRKADAQTLIGNVRDHGVAFNN